MRNNATLSWGVHHLELGERTLIMGALNVTPDSFSDGGRFFGYDNAVAQARQLVADGADIIDVGGESTRPLSDPVPLEEELRRVIPVIEKIAGRINVPISIDTNKAEVARQALTAGAAMINDISAMRADPGMAPLAAQSGVPVVLMHMLGTPKTMQTSPSYTDLIEEIITYFKKAMAYARKKGVDQAKLIIDPGIGFGKTFAHNFMLLNQLKAFKELKAPLLVGPSRKAFIRQTVKLPGQSDIDPCHPDVETGTQAAVAAAVLNGAQIVRVHDVATTRITVKLLDAIHNAKEEDISPADPVRKITNRDPS